MSTVPSTSDAPETDVPIPFTAPDTTDEQSELLETMFDDLLKTSASGFSLPSDLSDLSGLQDITDTIQGDVFDRHDQDAGDVTYTDHPALQVQFANADVAALYADRETANATSTDSGWDLHFPEDVEIAPGETKMLDLGVSVAAYGEDGDATGFWMMPRSSIVKTPLRMANSVGLIDASYRGRLKAVVDNVKTKPYVVRKGDRLFQLVAPSLRAFQWTAVDALPATERGEQGFGSTGK